MRTSFHGYYRPSDEELKTLWKECTFVLDANVLLDLHRFPVDVRGQLLAALGQVSSRVWIPYQAALEYQDNWLAVVQEQVGRYDKVREVVTKSNMSLIQEIKHLQLEKRHSSINPRKFLNGLERAVENFVNHIDSLKKKHDHSADDALRRSIERLLGDRIGAPPGSQPELDILYKDGQARFDNKLPPGYRDASKDGKTEAPLMHGGLLYQRKFGDLLLWKQILAHAKDSNIGHIVFVTNDEKDDWWHIERGKKLGPRRELVEEIRREAGVQFFHMYNTQTFLERAVRHLGSKIDRLSIEKVRDILEVTPRRRSVPSLTIEQIVGSLEAFDQGLRETPAWKGFPDRILHNRHKYAIHHNGNLYPVKKILSLASGLHVTKFSGGAHANRRIEESGLEVIPISETSDADESDEDDPGEDTLQ